MVDKRNLRGFLEENVKEDAQENAKEDAQVEGKKLHTRRNVEEDAEVEGKEPIEEINKPNELNFAADSLANLGHTIPVNIFVFGLLL